MDSMRQHGPQAFRSLESAVEADEECDADFDVVFDILAPTGRRGSVRGVSKETDGLFSPLFLIQLRNQIQNKTGRHTGQCFIDGIGVSGHGPPQEYGPHTGNHHENGHRPRNGAP